MDLINEHLHTNSKTKSNQRMDWTATNTSSLLLYQAGDSEGYIHVAWLHLELQSSKQQD